MVLEVTFFGGAGDYEHGELGGVQVLFNDLELRSSFMLDIGKRPDHFGQYFGFPYRPKSYDYLSLSDFLGMYPKLSGIYRYDYELHRGNKTSHLPIEGILLSHPHFDHAGGLTLVRHDLPVFMSRESKLTLYLWQNSGARTLNQFVDVYDQFTIVPNSVGGEKFLLGDEASLSRDIRIYEDQKQFNIGNFKITPYRVDHSIAGSYAFVIETSVGNLAISGDIRQRGRFPEFTHYYLEMLHKGNIKYFMLEGSLLHFEHSGNEKKVGAAVSELLKGRTMAAIAYPPREYERLTSLVEASKESGRMLVISAAQAIGLRSFDGLNGYPKIDSKHIGVLLPRKRKGLIDRPEFSEDLIERDYFAWERQFLDRETWGKSGEAKRKVQRVRLQDIRDNQDKFLVYMPFNSMLDMLGEINPRKGSIYIRSHPGPWTTEMEISETRQINFLKEHGMYDGPQPDFFDEETKRKMHQVHVTGHFNRNECRAAINKVIEGNPDVTLIPYHCMYPKDFPEDVAKRAKKVIVPMRGEKIILT